MRRGAVALALALIAVPAAARADLDNPFPDALVISPGIKLGYIFGGEGGGFTYGAELTMMWRSGADLSAIVAQGPALNISWSQGGTFQLRPGWQFVSWFIGIEAGPAIVRRDGHTHFGVGVSPWLGAIVVPYYTYTYLIGVPGIHEGGTYLKLPLCTSCEGGGSGFDFDDDD